MGSNNKSHKVHYEQFEQGLMKLLHGDSCTGGDYGLEDFETALFVTV